MVITMCLFLGKFHLKFVVIILYIFNNFRFSDLLLGVDYKSFRTANPLYLLEYLKTNQIIYYFHPGLILYFII